jgi:hypothetical protein
VFCYTIGLLTYGRINTILEPAIFLDSHATAVDYAGDNDYTVKEIFVRAIVSVHGDQARTPTPGEAN